MNKRILTKSATLFSLVTTIVLMLSLGVLSTAAQDDPEPIKIGLYAPMTGPVAFLGEGFEMGATMALEELEYEIEGVPVELVVADNMCNPTDAVNAIRKLIEVDEVDVILGGGCSSATVAAQPIIAEGETPAVSATSTNPSIYDGMGVGGNIWQFRVNPDDLIMANAFAALIAEDAGSLGLVAENTDFGRGALAAYKPLFEEMGVEVVYEDYFDLGTADYRAGLTAIRRANPDALLIVMTERDGSTFMRQLREVGLEQTIFSRGSLTSPLFVEFTEDDPTIGEGILEFSFWAFGLDPEHDEAFFERFETANSPHRGMSYYVVKDVIAEAIRAAIEETGEATRESIRDALAEIDIETPIGPVAFDDHNQAYPFGTIQTIQDGVPTLLDTIELVPVERETSDE